MAGRYGRRRQDTSLGARGSFLAFMTSYHILSAVFQEPTSAEAISAESPPLKHKLIASLEAAHGVHDVNSVAWCPRQGYEDLLATTGDDGHTRIWRVVST